jgi:hypothetical protein
MILVDRRTGTGEERGVSAFAVRLCRFRRMDAQTEVDEEQTEVDEEKKSWTNWEFKVFRADRNKFLTHRHI